MAIKIVQTAYLTSFFFAIPCHFLLLLPRCLAIACEMPWLVALIMSALCQPREEKKKLNSQTTPPTNFDYF